MRSIAVVECRPVVRLPNISVRGQVPAFPVLIRTGMLRIRLDVEAEKMNWDAIGVIAEVVPRQA